ncbi:hypothetical protein APSETT445_009521 [Aspergillus pseudonomiae]
MFLPSKTPSYSVLLNSESADLDSPRENKIHSDRIMQKKRFVGLYWDWSLDYRNLIASPIWDTDDGFGPSGSSFTSVANGRCVDHGPFANWMPTYYEGNYHPHCLSRGFQDETTVTRVGNLTVRPDILQGVIRDKSEYFDFLLAVETMSHLTIPYIVQGDFSKVTAPNDPVFFLHHAQVDRVWWSWQGIHDERRRKYNGIARYDSTAEASVSDALDLGFILENGAVVTVEDKEDPSPTSHIILHHYYIHSTVKSQLIGRKENAEGVASFETLQEKELGKKQPLVEDKPVYVIEGMRSRDWSRLYKAGVEKGNGTEEQRSHVREWTRTADKKSEGLMKEHRKLSTKSKLVFAHQSGHFVQLTQPDVVVDGVRLVLDNL